MGPRPDDPLARLRGRRTFDEGELARIEALFLAGEPFVPPWEKDQPGAGALLVPDAFLARASRRPRRAAGRDVLLAVRAVAWLTRYRPETAFDIGPGLLRQGKLFAWDPEPVRAWARGELADPDRMARSWRADARLRELAVVAAGGEPGAAGMILPERQLPLLIRAWRAEEANARRSE